MSKYLMRRLLSFLLVLIGVSILCFLLIELFGKDPAEVIARRVNINASQKDIEAMRVSLGLDKPAIVRYFVWIKGIFTGDVGTSFVTFKPIMQDVCRLFSVSMSIVLLSLLWIIIIVVLVSLLCARYKDKPIDHIVRIVTIIGISFPTFWLGFMLLTQFAVSLNIFTVLPKPGISGYILPSITLAIPISCSIIRLFRSKLINEMKADYVIYARARGHTYGDILIHHAFRNALPPIITVFCQYLGYLIAGTAVVESVFSVKGMGSYLVSAVLASDSTTVATCVVIIAAIFVFANLVGDIVNRIICPWMVREYND